MIKNSFCLVMIALMGSQAFCEVRDSKTSQSQKDFEMLDVHKGNTIRMTPEDTAQIKLDSEQTFAEGFEGSSPEVKAAILKAAQEEGKKAQETEPSAQ